MERFEAKNCRNFQGSEVEILEEQKVIHICTAPYCVDRNKCDGEIIEEVPDIHFEEK